MCCWYVFHIPFDHLRCILECCHMNYFRTGIILMCNFSWPSDYTILLLFFSRITWDIGSGISSFIFPNLIIGNFSLLGATVKCWLLIGWKNIVIFLGSLVGVHLVMPQKYAPSEVLHCWVYLITLLFSFGFPPGSFIGVSFGISPWLSPSEVLLGVLIFWIYRLGSSMIPCVHTLILLKGLHVLDYVSHRLYIDGMISCINVRHLWNLKGFGKKIYCVWYSFCSCLGDICFVTHVVFHCCYYVPAVFSMWLPQCTIIWSVMHNYYCARWG